MSDDRLRMPQDTEYFLAIGMAAVAVARLEWNAVWCSNRLNPGYINTIETGRKTAGNNAQDLTELFSRIRDEQMRAKVAPFAIEFSALVGDRNGLLHGKPGTAASGAQRLFRHGSEWSV